MVKKTTLAIILAILAIIALAGCGNGSDSKSGGDAAPVESKAAVNEDAGSDSSMSAEDTLPDGFPKEIPILEGSSDLVSLSSGDSMTVGYEVKKSFKEVLKVYKDYFKSAGYADMQETLIDDSYTGIGVRDGKQLLIMLSVTTDDPNLISVSITYKNQVQ